MIIFCFSLDVGLSLFPCLCFKEPRNHLSTCRTLFYYHADEKSLQNYVVVKPTLLAFAAKCFQQDGRRAKGVLFSNTTLICSKPLKKLASREKWGLVWL